MSRHKQLTRAEADLVGDILSDLAAGVCVLRYNRHDYDPWSRPTKGGRELLASAAAKLSHGTEAFGGDAFVASMSNETTRPKLHSAFGRTQGERAGKRKN